MNWSDPLIVLFLYIAAAWNLPDEHPARRAVRHLSPFVLWTGLWHSWKVFAPDPKRVIRTLVVEVTYGDHTACEWRFPNETFGKPSSIVLWSHANKFIENVLFEQVKHIRDVWVNYCLRQREIVTGGAGHPEVITLYEEIVPVHLPGLPGGVKGVRHRFQLCGVVLAAGASIPSLSGRPPRRSKRRRQRDCRAVRFVATPQARHPSERK